MHCGGHKCRLVQGGGQKGTLVGKDECTEWTAVQEREPESPLESCSVLELQRKVLTVRTSFFIVNDNKSSRRKKCKS